MGESNGQTANTDGAGTGIDQKKTGDGEENKGSTGANWREGLPEDIRSLQTLEKFKDESEMIQMPINVARSYIAAEQLIGRDKIPVPKTPEEWESAYTRLGRPDTPELYTLPVLDTLPKELKTSIEEDAKWFRKEAHGLGLNGKQATELFAKFSNRVTEQVQKSNTADEGAKAEAEAVLRGEFGTNYDGKMILANRAIHEFGGEELSSLVENVKIGSNPTLIKAFAKIGGMIAEDLGLDKNTGAYTHSKETVSEQIATLQGSPEYIDASNPLHIGTVAKVAKLMQVLHGNTPIGR